MKTTRFGPALSVPSSLCTACSGWPNRSAGEKPPHPPPPAAPRPAARLEALPEKKPPALAPLAPLGRRLKQRVARGREAIDARLDLHGYTQTEAHAALLRFLQRAQANGAQDGARRDRQGNRPRDRTSVSAAYSSGRCRCGCRCRNSDRWSSDSRTRISAMAEKARCMFGCGGRDRVPQLTLIIGLPTEAQETVKFVCKDDALDRSTASCPKSPKHQSQPIPKRDDFRGNGLPRQRASSTELGRQGLGRQASLRSGREVDGDDPRTQL